MFYTTGTTGDPKGVYYTHRQLVLHTYHLAADYGFLGGAACRLSSDDVYMPLTPMFHVHAWGFPYLATMYGMKQVYAGKLDPALATALLRTEGVTFSHCVPTIIKMILDTAEATGTDLSRWKVISGGAAMPLALAKRALQMGVDLRASYGMSETCPVVSSAYIPLSARNNDIDWQARHRSRTGVWPAFTDMRVVGPDGIDVPKDDTAQGEIILRAPWLTTGYLYDPERGAQLWEGGYLHTGDVATIDSRNSIRIADRIKDVIKSGGEWISSIALESLIGQHPWVAEVAVIGLPDPKWGERPCAWVVTQPGHTLSSDILLEHLDQFVTTGELSRWALPDHFRWVDSIPKTSVGKLDKKAMRLS
jgi:fatty-acyl-CoA synthase